MKLASNKRKWTFALLFIGGALLIWTVFRFSTEPSDPSTQKQNSSEVYSQTSTPADVVFPVEVSLARRGDLVKRLSLSGIVRAKREVEFTARVAGEIVSVAVYNGKYVKQGELLVKLDDREHRVAFEKARAALLSAQIEYKSLSSVENVVAIDSIQLKEQIAAARAKYQQAEVQFKQGQLSEEEFVRAKRDYEADFAYYNSTRGDLVANKSGLTQAQEMYARAKMNLEWTEIRAPFSGYVANCELNERMQVQAGKVLFKLIDVSTLFVDVEVLESEIGKIAVGREAEVRVNAYPKESFLGKVLTINPIVDPKSKTVKVTIELKTSRPLTSHHSPINHSPINYSPFLRPGMFATVKLETDIFKGRVLVPKEALLVRDQRTLVFVASAGLAKWHYVEVGEENEEYVEIRSGITAGDSVIVSGHYTLAHDARIRVAK